VEGLNGSFWHWQVPGLEISSVATCFNGLNIHSVDFASLQPLIHISFFWWNKESCYYHLQAPRSLAESEVEFLIHAQW